MFPHSKTVNKSGSDWTKTTHMLTEAVPKPIISDLNEELLLTRWYGLATDGSSDEDDKFLPVLVRLVDKDLTLIATSLLGMPNMKIDSIPQHMYDVCNEVREAFSLDWDNCDTYSSDSANSMTGKHNSLRQNIGSAQDDRKIFNVIWPCHLAHFCTGKGAKDLSVNVEDFVIDISYHFRRSVKKKKQLREFMNFNNTVAKVVN